MHSSFFADVIMFLYDIIDKHCLVFVTEYRYAVLCESFSVFLSLSVFVFLNVINFNSGLLIFSLFIHYCSTSTL